MRTCIATSTSVSASFSLFLIIVSSVTTGGKGREGFISYKLFRRPTYLPYVRMYICTARGQRKPGTCVTRHARLLDRMYAPLHTRLFTPGFSFLKAIVRYATPMPPTLALASARDSPKYFLSYVTNCLSTGALIACRLSY